MFKSLTIVFFSSILLIAESQAQFKFKIDSLNTLINKAASDSDKLVALSNLAAFYYIYQLDKEGDSILQKQLEIAEISDNKNLIPSVLFGSTITNITNTKNMSSWRSKATLNRAAAFIKKGLEYSKSILRDDYTTLSYLRLSELYRSMGELENAFSNAVNANTISKGIKNDSIKIVAAIELGNVYQARGESLLAYKTFTNAYDDAVNFNFFTLQSEVFHCYAVLYESLGNNEQAKENLHRSIELNKQKQLHEGLIKDYIEYGRLWAERHYINKALRLADSIHLEKYIIQAKRLIYGFYAFVVANSDSTIQYILRNEDLKQVYFYGDSIKKYSILGSIYHYASKCDSAIYYMKMAEPGFEKKFGTTSLQDLYAQLADCYYKINKPQEAIIYYQKAANLSEQLQDPVNAVNYSSSLCRLYEITGNYKEAFTYSRKAITLKDSLQKLSDKREFTLMEVNNEKKEHELNLEKIAQQKLVKTNLQYMAITIAISLIFIVMILSGMFQVTKFTNKILGYFAFISLFEFVILLLDTFLHKITHGEPLKIWLLKIIIVAILAPFHHYLEKGMTKFLESQILIKLREKMAIKIRWPRQHKIVVPQPETDQTLKGDVL